MKRVRSGNKHPRKCFDCNITTTGLAGWTVYEIPPIMLGSEFYQRTGRVVTLEEIEVKYYSITSNNRERLVLVYDHSGGNLAKPGSTDVLLDHRTDGVTSQDIISGRNMLNDQKFEILFDKTFIGTSSTCNMIGDRVGTTIYADRDQVYNDTNGGTFLDISSGRLWLLAWQNSGLISLRCDFIDN